MLFYLNETEHSDITRVKASTFNDLGWLEKDLESLIAENITRLIPENQLMILFRQRLRQEEADIYALDVKGDLYIFELKRWEGRQENILQVLRYGQIYGQYTYDQLQSLLKKYGELEDINLAEAHAEYFELDTKLEANQFNSDQHFIVITNGIDRDTLNAINYWQNRGLNVESIIYKVYQNDGKPILEFNPYNPENEVIVEEDDGYFIVNTNTAYSKTNYREMLDQDKAAAYYRKKRSITNIIKSNTVFLYQSGLGIIAYGKAIEDWKKAEIDGIPDEEYYIKLKF